MMPTPNETSDVRTTLERYRDPIAGCRFCTMCKPAGDVANLTQIEGHTTRSRAMLLWRVLVGASRLEGRVAELLYQSTLDGISEAWCIEHYRVSDYLLAARAQAYARGQAPPAVRAAVERPGPPAKVAEGDTVLLAGDVAECGQADRVETLLRALAALNHDAAPAVMLSGAVAYALGAHEQATEQAHAVADVVRASGATTVVCDGPQTLWAVTRVFPALGVDLPPDTRVTSVTELAATTSEALERSHGGVGAFVHDSPYGYLITRASPERSVLLPGARTTGVRSGDDPSYRALRRVVERADMVQMESIWTRSLARSSGADAGLWLTYPVLARGLAQARLDTAASLGAEAIVTDSLLDAIQFAACDDARVAVHWLPELLARSG